MNILTNNEINKISEIGKHIDILLNKKIPELIFSGNNSMNIVNLIDEYYLKHEITSIRNFVIDGDIITTNVHISMGNVISHGNPILNKIFESGDLVRVDLVGFKNGLYCDAARTFVVDNKFKTEEEKILHFATYEALKQVQKYVKVGNPISKISKIIERVAKNNNLYVSPLLGGHGIGAKLHSEPFVPNVDKMNNSIKKDFPTAEMLTASEIMKKINR